MKILVTGAGGQLGGELCRVLGPAAVAADSDTLDLAHRPSVLKFVGQAAPDAVINCAAYTGVDQAESDPRRCRLVNATVVRYLVEACRPLGCPLVQLSTDYVFGGPAGACEEMGQGASRESSRPNGQLGSEPVPISSQAQGEPRPYREDDPPSPRGVYATAKLEGERAAAENPRHLVVRTCGLYARPTRQPAHNFVSTILRLARSRTPVRVVGDQHCTPSYVPHVARAILFLLGADGSPPARWGIYHVTNSGATTWYEFACEIVRLSGIEARIEPISTEEYGAAAPRPRYSVLDTTAYHRLGGPPMPDWKSALAEYFAERKQLWPPSPPNSEVG